MSPRSSARAYTLGFTAADFCPQAKEILVNVAYKLKEKQPLLDIGHTVAKQQFVVREYDCKAGFGLAASARPVEVTRWERGARVEGDTWQVFFSRDGFLAAYTVDGRELMAEGAELRPAVLACPDRERPRGEAAPASGRMEEPRTAAYEVRRCGRGRGGRRGDPL